MNNEKNVLIVACGSNFGASLAYQFGNNNYNVYGISGTAQSEKILQIDWKTCSIDQFEKFLRNLPGIDCVIFNQNSKSVTEQLYSLGSIPVLGAWKQSKHWIQSHYVNCVLPVHMLHTLVGANKLNDRTRIVWVLSQSIMNNISPGDYIGQKYQNYITMQNFAKQNKQTFIGVCPGKLDQTLWDHKSQKLMNFLTKSDSLISGKFYAFDQQTQDFNLVT